VTDEVLEAFAGEAQSLAAGLARVPDAAFSRVSPCPPWTAGELVRHVATGAGRVCGMLAEPEPPAAGLVSAAGYYQADRRFSAATNADRIAAAQRDAAGRAPAELRADFDRAWRAAAADAGAAAPGRRVRTRHGDTMLLTDFMRTRVLELAVHGLDLAAGSGQPPWLTGRAAGVVEELILPGGDGDGGDGDGGDGGDGGGGGAAGLRRQLGWDRVTLIAKATGRSPLTGAERDAVTAAGLRWLALG
jgi:uncharacterized protein (TIGR03083 family)